MTRTPYTNHEVANARFLRNHLARHGGDAKAAAQHARELGAMAEHGAGWWNFIAAECAVLHARTVRRTA